MDDTLTGLLAHRFAQSTGLEFDDLFQEARLAYFYAQTSPSYDPRKAAFCTFASTCIHRHLCTVVMSHKKKFPLTMEVSEHIPDRVVGQENVANFGQLVRQLPQDGKIVLKMMFNADRVTPYRVRASVRRALRPRWSHSRIEQAFQSIQAMLSQLTLGG